MNEMNRIRGFKNSSAFVLATAFGAGLVPRAPGTAGALAAVPLAFFSNAWEWPARVLLWSALTIAGIWAAKTMDEVYGTGDNQKIVIDEVIGLGITAWTAGQDWKALIAAFVLFRFFDIAKPPPVRQLDRWSKKKAAERTGASAWWGGFGVIADDVVAGFQGLAVILILQAFQILPRS